jgi:hypothetical protein
VVRLILQVQLSQHLEERRVAEAMKMVIALQLHAGKAEAGRHAAEPVIRLDQDRPMAQAREFVGHRQPHRAAADHSDSGEWLIGESHQNGISTWLNR